MVWFLFSYFGHIYKTRPIPTNCGRSLGQAGPGAEVGVGLSIRLVLHLTGGSFTNLVNSAPGFEVTRLFFFVILIFLVKIQNPSLLKLESMHPYLFV